MRLLVVDLCSFVYWLNWYIENASSVSKGNVDKEIEIEDGSKNIEDGEKKSQMPPASVMTRLILIMVWRKLIRNPNTYASLIGLIWSLISYRYFKHLRELLPYWWAFTLMECNCCQSFCRWNIQMPSIVKGSISILSDAGLGMAMFSLGILTLTLKSLPTLAKCH